MDLATGVDVNGEAIIMLKRRLLLLFGTKDRIIGSCRPNKRGKMINYGKIPFIAPYVTPRALATQEYLSNFHILLMSNKP